MVDKKKIDIIRNSKPVVLLDIIIIGLIFLLTLLLLFFVIYDEEGEYLSVTYNGQESFYSLLENKVFEVDGHITVKIENGYAFVIKSDCKNHDCEIVGGRIKYVGQKIVCLPNKIVLKVVRSKEHDPGWVTT